MTTLRAQSVTIISVNTLPAVLTDTQNIRTVVSDMFTSGGCPLINFNHYLMNDTVHLTAYYQVGNLTVICNSTDTFNLGILPCTTTMLHVQAIMSGGGSAVDDFFLAININCIPTGVSEINNEDGFFVFPNPVSGYLFLRIVGNEIFLQKISIVNLFGELIFSANDIESKNDKIDVSVFPKGIYFIQVETKNGIYRKKFIKD